MSNQTITLGPADGVSKLHTPGMVYFCQAESGGLIKIGWATNPALRVANLQNFCPIKLVILLQVHGSGRLELGLHRKFAEARRHGEWFEPSPALLDLIETLKREPPEKPAWEKKERKTYALRKRRARQGPPPPVTLVPFTDEEIAQGESLREAAMALN